MIRFYRGADQVVLGIVKKGKPCYQPTGCCLVSHSRKYPLASLDARWTKDYWKNTKMSIKNDTFSAAFAQAIGTTWNNEKVIFVPEDQRKRSYVAKCKYIENNKMIIEKKNGDIAFISISDYKDMRLLYPKNYLEVDKSEVV